MKDKVRSKSMGNAANSSVNRFGTSSPIQKRLIIFLCIVALIASMFSVHFSTKSDLNKTGKNVAHDFTSIMKSYKHSFTLFEVIIQQEIKHAENTAEIESFLKQQDKRFLDIEGEDYDGIYMYYNGQYLYSWDTPRSVYEKTGYDATKRPWYIGAVEAEGEIFFSTPYPSYANDYMLATISRLQDDGETVIAYDIKLGEIGRFVDKLDIYDEALALICDSDGNIIGSTNHLYQGGNYTYSQETLYQNTIDAQQELINADDAKEKANAEQKIKSAEALNNYGVERFEFLKNLLSHNETLRYSLKDFTFGYACGNGIYTCFVTASIIELVPQLAIWWAALSFAFILIAFFLLKMMMKSHQVLTDILTGLNNRRAFNNYCNNHIRHHSCEKLGLLMLDLDQFKEINDVYGHAVGDEALLDTSTILKNACSTLRSCFLCRYGGDEFLLAIKKCEIEDLNKIKETITEGFEKNNQTKKYSYALNASIGVSCGICGDKKSMEALIKQADKSMYEEKNAKGVIKNKNDSEK